MKKRFLALVMAVITVFGVFGTINVSAYSSGETHTLYNAGAYNAQGHRYNHGTSTSGTGIAFIDINGKAHNRAWGYLDAIHIDSYSGPLAYCIEMGTALGESGYVTEDISFSTFWSKISGSGQHYMSLVTMYGYPNFSYGAHWVDAYAATQCLLWEFSINFRINPNGFNNPNGYDGSQIYNMVIKGHPAESVYNQILAKIREHDTVPTFAAKSAASAPVHKMTWNTSTNRCEYVVPTSQVSSYKFTTLPSGVGVTTSGSNTIFYTTTKVDANSGVVTMKKDLPAPSQNILVFRKSGGQTCVTGTAEDPVAGFFRLESELVGNLSIIKTTKNNGGNVAGFQFEVRNSSNTLIGTYTSTSSGKIDIQNLIPGVYSVREINLSNDFVEPTPNPVNVEVKPGQTASVSFDNVKKRGVITIKKINTNPSMGDYPLAGAVFEIRDQGNTLVDTVIVNASGTGQSTILPLGVYRITEKSSPPTGGYVRNTETYTVTLSGTQGSAAIVYAPDAIIPEQPQVARINIVKTNSNPSMGDYSVAGAVFEIRDSGGTLVDTVTVGADGKGQSKDLKLGKGYKVTEKSAPYGFARNKNTFTVDLNYGGEDKTVIYETVDIPQRPQTGCIRITKYNSASNLGDYNLTGAKFEIRNTVTGDLMDTVTVDSTGYGISKELPLTQTGKYEYSCREISAPWGYTLNSQTFYPVLSYAGMEIEITYTDVSVPQRPQTGKITIEKQDIYSGRTPSGDADLSGAVFQIFAAQDIKKLDGSIIYRKDELADTLYCGSDTKATSKELPLGTYYWKESSPPPIGYTPDQTANEIKIEYQGQNVSIVYLDRVKTNKPIEGQISIVKHTDLADPQANPENPQIEKPIQATFEIYLAKAGSYNDAKDRERDIITTDPDNGGYAISKKLPYGLYVVKEVWAEGDVKLVEPFTVMINQEGKVYRYILNDYTFKSLVKIRKVDSTTGKTIPAAGVSFKVWDVASNRWVTQHYNYPVPTDIDVFETSGDGTLVMPEVLPSGDYLLYEQPGSVPYGYILSEEPIPFTVHSSQQDPEILEVWMANKPAMGVIKIVKTGQVLTGVQQVQTKFGTQYIPIFSQAAVSGQVFDVIAKTDIITPDGTLRAAKGTAVDTVKIVNGTGESKQLFLGDYLVVERDCGGEPFIKNNKQYTVSLVYENETVEVVTTSIAVENIRQQVEIELQKLMERPVTAPDGFNAFADVVFGLFADEAIRDHMGNIVIPKDGLIALMTLDENGKGTLTGELPFSKVYVKELQTNHFYQLNPAKYPLDINYQGESVTKAKFQINNGGVAIPNETKLGKIAIEKQGEMLVGATVVETKNGTVYTPIYEISSLPGVTFRVICDEDFYDVYGKLIHKKGDEVDRIVTGPDGRAESSFLRLGRYILIEDVPYGYVAKNNQIAVTLGFDGEVTNIITKRIRVENQRQKAELQLTKLCEIPEGAQEDYNPYPFVMFGIFAAEDIKTADGKIAIPKNSLVEVLSFEKNQAVAMETNLPISSYYAKELRSAPGYELSDTRYDFTFEYNPDGGAVILIHINNGEPIENKLQRGSLKIIKEFEGRTIPISNVPFTIIGETTVGTIVAIHAETDGNGEILLENLLVGNYRIVELDSPLTVNYILSPEENATVAADQITELTIHNELKRAKIKVIKTDGETKTPLEGVTFEVIDPDGNVVCEIITGPDGTAETDLLPVNEKPYIVREKTTLKEYVLNDTPHEILLSEHEKVYELELQNVKIKGRIRIFKYTDNNTPIEGAVFGIFNEKGELVEEIRSGSDGYATSGYHNYGKYKIVELSVVTGFILDQTPLEMEITENDKTYDFTFKNERIPEIPDNPKTGDSSNLGLWLAIGGAACCVLVLTLAFKRRKK